MTHALKTWPEYYEAILKGYKTFELRLADRPFNVGDTLLLQEYNTTTEFGYTGNEIKYMISYIFEGGKFGLQEGYVILGIREIQENY